MAGSLVTSGDKVTCSHPQWQWPLPSYPDFAEAKEGSLQSCAWILGSRDSLCMPFLPYVLGMEETHLVLVSYKGRSYSTSCSFQLPPVCRCQFQKLRGRLSYEVGLSPMSRV